MAVEGGAICIHGVDYLTIRNCIFENNLSLSHGGAIFIRTLFPFSLYESIIIEDCSFKYNSAP